MDISCCSAVFVVQTIVSLNSSFGSCREIQLTHAQHDYHLEILIVYLDIAGVERGDDNRTLKVEIRIERTLKCLCLVWYGPGGRRDLSTLVTPPWRQVLL